MKNNKQPQLLINMKEEDIPTDKKDSRYSAFWENEKMKVERGVNIDGFQFSGWLYWHINHWVIFTDVKKDWGEIVPEKLKPYLRDNEVIINNALLRAEKERKGLPIMGLRQLGKTTFESSYSARSGILFKGSQNLIMSSNSDDLNNITQNIDFGLLNCSPYFRIPRISRDWGSERVLLGVKHKSGDNMVHSTFVIRNTTGGKRTEKGAGVTNLKSNVWDEIGKDNILEAFTATKPAMLGEFGWRTIPILVGTGGNMEKCQDAKKLFFSPQAHNMLEFIQDNGRVTGLYMPGWLRHDCKYKTSLAAYLIQEGILKEENIPSDSELWMTSLAVSDKEKAIQKIKDEIERYLEAGDTSNALKWRMYYPLEIDDIFLSESNNNFPVEHCKRQQSYLQENYTPEYVEFYRDKENKPLTRSSDLRPIDVFPVKQANYKIAPVCLYEPVIYGLPFTTYVMGIDPINEDTSSDREVSLGSFYVYKRMYNPFGEFQNQMVASFSGRFASLKEFHQLCLDVAEYYNALVLPENEEKTLIQFFINKKKDYLLFNAIDLSKRINPLTKTNRTYGLSAATVNQRYGMTLIVEDTKDMYLKTEENEEMGVYKILDPMLLEEMINYRGKPQGSKGIHDGNFDRIISWYHTMILAKHLDNVAPLTNVKIQKKEDNTEKPQHLIKDAPWFSVLDKFKNPTKKSKSSPFLYKSR